MTSSIKKLTFASFLILTSCCLFLASCGCEEDCAAFEKFQLCDTEPDKEGCSENLNVLAQDADYITVSVEITDAKPDDLFTYTLFAKDNGNFVKIAEDTKSMSAFSNIDGDESRIRASRGFPRNSGSLLPVGEYQVQIELTQETIPLNRTQSFRVE